MGQLVGGEDLEQQLGGGPGHLETVVGPGVLEHLVRHVLVEAAHLEQRQPVGVGAPAQLVGEGPGLLAAAGEEAQQCGAVVPHEVGHGIPP